MHPLSEQGNRPVILLAFANDREDGVRYLRDLAKERSELQDLLESLNEHPQIEKQGLIDLHVLYNVTVDTLVERLRECSGRIAVIHYGGHATSLALLLEKEDGSAIEVDGQALVTLLGMQEGLKLVFLNGCLTERHMEALLEAGVPAVVGTTTEVDDAIARAFAVDFYRELAGGRSIDAAFQRAVAAGRVRWGKPSSGYRVVDEQMIITGPLAWPWILQLRAGAEEVANWNIPAAAGDYLLGLPELPPSSLPENPYHRALAWYGAAEARIFFGRGRQIRDLHQRLSDADSAPVVLLYGQSGVGKSSLLEAGVRPRLEGTHQVRYRRRRRELGASGTLCEALAMPSGSDGRTLAAAWRAAEEAAGQPLIVLLDQVEEVLTRPMQEQEEMQAGAQTDASSGELDTLAQLAADIFAPSPLQPQGKLLLSFRKEYLPEIEKPLRQRNVNRTYVFLEQLDAQGIVEVVRGPLSTEQLQNKYGLTVDPGLEQQIARDLSADPSSPIATVLQILLTAMWERARGDSVTNPHFSEALYAELRHSSTHLDEFVAQRMADFARVLPKAESSGLLLDLLWYCTNDRGTAEQRSADAITERYGPDRDMQPIVQKAIEMRLLADLPSATDEAAAGGARLAHDTLAPIVREKYMRSTLPGQRASRLLQSHLNDRQPQTGGAEDQAVLDEQDLATVENGLEGMRLPTPEEAALIAASRVQRARAQRRRRLLVAAAAAVGALILLLAGATSWFSWYAQRNAEEAQRQEQIALANAANWENANAANAAQLLQSQSREVAAVAENRLRDGDAQLALQLSLEAFTQITKTVQAETALRESLNQWQGLRTLAGHGDTVTGLFFSPDDRYLASASVDDTARVWDLTTGEAVVTIDEHAGDVTSALISGDGRYLVTSSRDGTTRIWSLPDGKLLHRLLIGGITDGIRSVGLHANGRWIALRAGAEIWLYDIASGEPVAQSPYMIPADQPVAVRSLAFTTDGAQILAGGDDTLPHIWEIASGATAALAPPEGTPGHQSAVLSFQQTRDLRFFASLSTDRLQIWERSPDTGTLTWRAVAGSEDGVRYTGQFLFSPDSRYLVAATQAGSLRIWSLDDLTARPQQFDEFTTGIAGIWFSPDGRLLAAAGSDGGDGVVRTYDMRTEVSTVVARLPGSSLSAPVFSRDGTVLAAADQTGVIHLWRVWPGGDRPALRLHSYAANAAALAGEQVVVAGSNGAVELRDLADASLQVRRIGEAYYTAAAVSDDGKVAAVADITGILAVIDVESGRVLGYWRAEQQRVEDLQFLPGDLLAAAGAIPAVHVWNWRTRQLAYSLDEPTNDVAALVYDRLSDRLYAADRNGYVHRWQMGDRTALPVWRAGAPLLALAVSADGEQVVAAGADARLFWWPSAAAAGSAAAPRSLAVRSPIRSLAFAADGRLLAGAENGELQLWDLPSRSAVTVDAHSGRWIKDIEVDGAARRAITVGDDGWLKQWLLTDEAIVQLACSRTNGALSAAEWEQLFDFGALPDLTPCDAPGAAAGGAGMNDQPPALTFSELITDTSPHGPAVLFFESVQGSHVPAGARILLRWSVVNATQVDLEYQGFDMAIAPSGEKLVQINETTTFRLLVRNPQGAYILNLTVSPHS